MQAKSRGTASKTTFMLPVLREDLTPGIEALQRGLSKNNPLLEWFSMLSRHRCIHFKTLTLCC